MKKLPLDLSKFRKVKSDGDTSTFQHYEGHHLTIAHNKLSKSLRGELDKIPLSKGKVKQYAEGAIASNDEEPEESVPVNINESPKIPEKYAAAPNPQNSLVPATPEMPNAALDPGPATVNEPMNTDPFGTMGAFKQQMTGLKEVGAGQQAEARAVGQAGAKDVAHEQEYQSQLKEHLSNYEQSNALLTKERQSLMSDIAQGHVDPKRYVNNMSTGSKISTGIGLVLGGMGSGLTHGPDLAFQYLQSQIDRDIQSQRDELGKKNSLLSHNLSLTKDLRQAYDLTKIQSNDILSSHLRMTADQTADPIAKAKMMQIAGMTDQQTAELQHKMSLMKMQQSAFSGQPLGDSSGVALESLAPEMRERAVKLPGGGMRLGITKEGAKEVREQVQSIQPIFDSLDKLQNLGPSALVPGTPAYQEAHAIRAQLIPLVNENAGLKRLSSEDIGNIKEMFNDPTKFSSLLGSAKTNAFKSFLQNKLMSTMGSQLEGGLSQAKQAPSNNFGFKPRKN